MFKSVVNVDYCYHPSVFAGTVKTVDESNFRPDAEQVRALKFNPAGGIAASPVYDYDDGKVPKDDKVTDTIVALRSGRLDKADVDKLKRDIGVTGSENAKALKDAKLRDAVEKTLGVSDN